MHKEWIWSIDKLISKIEWRTFKFDGLDVEWGKYPLLQSGKMSGMTLYNTVVSTGSSTYHLRLVEFEPIDIEPIKP